MTIRRRSPDHAHLIAVGTPRSPEAAVLVLHGGRSMSQATVRASQVAVLRLRSVASAVARTDGVAVYRLQLAIRGWNGTGAAAMRDARWALAELRTRHPGLPIVLVGHSMGGRMSFRLGGDPDVIGVVGLAPWLPPDEPIKQLTRTKVSVIHGSRDRTISERSTRPFLARLPATGVAVDHTVLTGTGHAMLRRWRVWHALTAAAVTSIRVRSVVTLPPDGSKRNAR